MKRFEIIESLRTLSSLASDDKYLSCGQVDTLVEAAEAAIDYVKNAIDPAHWVEDESKLFCRCSHCNAKSDSQHDKFCRECGAPMRQEGKDNG